MERLPLIRFVLPALLAGLLAGGCTGGDTAATKKEEESFRNPSKTPPAGAGNIGGPPKEAKGGK